MPQRLAANRTSTLTGTPPQHCRHVPWSFKSHPPQTCIRRSTTDGAGITDPVNIGAG
ncbi:MAG: hypothetical protein WCH99_19160 [Verrucomicrobiota bacterium]